MTQLVWKNEAQLSAGSAMGRNNHLYDYRQANAEIIRKVVAGQSIDTDKTNPATAAHLVFNVAAVHVRAILDGGYRNAYELAAMSAGDPTPTKVSDTRRWVDDGIASIPASGGDPQNFYFGAVELNGAGMRYYGDMCLAISRDKVALDSLILFRNSYDLERMPIKSRISGYVNIRNQEALALSGKWQPDLADMIICKIMDGGALTPRLLTTGLISDGILSDEDYIEAPRQGSFTDRDVAEIRTSAADAADEAIIADHLSTGAPPSLARLLWRHRRRDAERAAIGKNIAVRIVTSSGRVR